MGSTTVNSAPPRDYAKETGDTLATQIALAPDLYNSEALYQPKYNQLQMQLAQEAVLGKESGFNTQAYAQSRPDLARNWQNSLNNPEGATESNILKYGSFENYLNADWEASGADSRFATGGKSGGLIQTYAGLQPQLSAISAQSNSAQRAADIADVARLGPAATEAFKNANPELFKQLTAAGSLQKSDNLGLQRLNAALGTAPGQQNISAQQITGPNINAQMVGRENTGFNNINTMDVNAQQMASPGSVQAQQLSAAQVAAPQQVQAGLIQSGTLGASLYNQALNAGPSRISSALESAVLGNLTADGSLSPAEQRQAEQQVRASYAARGMAMSPQAISAEVQNRLVNQRQRAVENMGLAGQVNQQLQAEQAANRGFAGNVFSGDVNVQQQNVGNQFSAAQFNNQAALQAALANQGASNQLALANQSTGLQAGQFNVNTQAQLQAQNQDAALRAALANQQNYMAGQQFNAANQSSVDQANRDAAQQAGLANQAANLQQQQLMAQYGYQGQLANQQANLGTAESNRAYQAQQLQNYYQNLGQAGQLYNQNMGADRAYSAQLVGLQQATMSDPYQAILGRPSAAFAQQQGISGQGANLTQMGGPALFNPESSYANNIYGGNQQATNAANIATAQSNAAVIGGAMQGLGSLAGGSLGAAVYKCWVAREIYGVNDPKWKRFRTWLLTRAPKWFHDFYCKYGAQFAEFISDKPRTKSLIRRWMDSRIATLK
jgi:hypothetical protein